MILDFLWDKGKNNTNEITKDHISKPFLVITIPSFVLDNYFYPIENRMSISSLSKTTGRFLSILVHGTFSITHFR